MCDNIEIMFNNWLLEKLRDENISQADLAKLTGLTTAAISKYASGRTPDVVSLRKIAKALKVPFLLILEKAGIIQQADLSVDDWTREMTYQLTQLTDDEDRALVGEIIGSFLRRAEEREVKVKKEWRR